MRAVLLPCLILFALLAPLHAAAQVGDGAYGRLDGDLSLSAGLGGGPVFGQVGGPDATGAATLELRARVVDTGGPFLAGEWRPEGPDRIVVGVDLRPVFLIRFLMNAESGDPWLDLFVDSIGLDLGAAIGPLDSGVGAAFAFGAGVDVPLFLPNGGVAGALFLRLGMRYVASQQGDAFGPAEGASDVLVLAALTVRATVSVGVASREPARYRVRE